MCITCRTADYLFRIKQKSLWYFHLEADYYFEVYKVIMSHPLSTYAKFPEKLTFLTTRTFAYQEFRNLSFSENFA